MGKINGNDMRLFVSGFDLSGSQNEIDLTVAIREVLDRTAFEDSAERVLGGNVRRDVLRHGGFFDDDAGDINDLLVTRMGTFHIFLVSFGFVAERQSIHAGANLATEYRRTAGVGDLVGASAVYASDRPFDHIAFLALPKTIIGSFPFLTGNVDDLAASTNGANMVVQVFATSPGGGTVTLELRESTDNFVGDDTLLMSSSALQARDAERIEAAGAVKQFRRVNVVGGGGLTSATVALSFQRNP